MITLCALWFCLVAVATATPLSITDFAVPSAVKVGENAELQCRFEGPPAPSGPQYVDVKWWWTPLHKGQDNKKEIYVRLGNQEAHTKHMNITIKDNDTIEILNLQPKQSGTFECEVYDTGDSFQENRKQQAMIVYAGSQPDLMITQVPDGPDEDTEDDVTIECQADGVAPEPDLVIDIDGEQQGKLNTLIVTNSNGTYDIYTNVTVSKADVIDKEVRCELFYKNDDVAHEAYVNTVTYGDEGGDLVSTETPDDGEEPQDVTTEPLQSDDDNHSSMIQGCIVLLVAVLTSHLLITP